MSGCFGILSQAGYRIELEAIFPQREIKERASEIRLQVPFVAFSSVCAANMDELIWGRIKGDL